MITTVLAEAFRAAFPIEVVVKGSLILALALLAARLRRRAPASARHRVLGLAIVATLVLPLLVLVAPDWEVAPLPALHAGWQGARSAATVAASPFADQPASGSTAAPSPASASAPLARPVAWASGLSWLWIAGAALVGLRLLVALAAVGRVLRRATAVSAGPPWETARRCQRTIGLSNPVPLLTSDRAGVPFTWGWWRPRIVLPADCGSWSERKLTVVLLHEMAHIKRWDALVNLVAELASIIYWFNPFLWLARRRLLVERERASDDCVLGAGIKGSEYAGYLMEFARVIRGRRWMPELQVAMARRTRLEERIVAIVNPDRRRSGASSRPKLASAALLALLILLPLASLRLFAKSDDEPTGPAAAARATDGSVTPGEREALSTVLEEFHAALYAGDDYEEVADRFLTGDYFDDPELTFENWSPRRRDEVMRNTLAHVRAVWGGFEEGPDRNLHRAGPLRAESNRLVYSSEPLDCRKRDGEYHLTQRVNIRTEGPSAEAAYMVRDLVQTIVFAEEGGELKIRRYAGGVNIRRMGVDNPYGPIFIVTLDGDEATVPTGPMLFKSIPRSLVPDNTSMIPLRSQAAAR